MVDLQWGIEEKRRRREAEKREVRDRLEVEVGSERGVAIVASSGGGNEVELFGAPLVRVIRTQGRQGRGNKGIRVRVNTGKNI